MGLITVEELQVFMDRTFSPGQAAQAQLYIDIISAYVENDTGVSFSLHEEETVRQQADYYGELALQPRPVVEVHSVTALAGNYSVSTYGNDHFGTLFGLRPHGVYDVNMTYGYEEVPVDIKGYVMQAAAEVVNNPTSLASYRVGDVTEEYRGAGGSMGSSFKDMNQATLDSYKRTEETWKLGPRQFQGYPQLPLL